MTSLSLRRILLALLAVAVVAGAWFTPMDRVAHSQVEAGLQRALTAFAAARALGAVISVAQGTQVEVTPAGVGLSLAPGQALQPLNELVDRFGAVMLAASVAFGIQLLLLNIGGHVVVSALACAAVLLWVALRWRSGAPAPRWLQPVVVGLLLVRFAVPLGALANEAVYRTFMADDYRTALGTIERSPDAVIGRTTTTPPAQDEGFIERMRQWAKGLPDLKSGYDAILNAASDWTGKMVRLIAVFALQTVVLPVGFLWLSWRLARWAVQSHPRPT